VFWAKETQIKGKRRRSGKAMICAFERCKVVGLRSCGTVETVLYGNIGKGLKQRGKKDCERG